MTKFKLIEKNSFYVNDNYNDETYLTSQIVLSGEAGRLLDDMIEDTQKTMQELNKQLEQQIKAKQELMTLVDVMTGDDE